MRKEIVLYDVANRTQKRFNLLDVEDIQWYDGGRIFIFLDDGTHHECTHFEIERVA